MIQGMNDEHLSKNEEKATRPKYKFSLCSCINITSKKKKMLFKIHPNLMKECYLKYFFNDSKSTIFDQEIYPYLDRKDLVALNVTSKFFYLNQTPNMKLAVVMSNTLQIFLNYRFNAFIHPNRYINYTDLDKVKFPLTIYPLTFTQDGEFTIGFHQLQNVNFPFDTDGYFNKNTRTPDREIVEIFFEYSQSGIFTNLFASPMKFLNVRQPPPDIQVWNSQTKKLHFELYPQTSTQNCKILCYIVSNTNVQDRTLYISFDAKKFSIEVNFCRHTKQKKQHFKFAAKLL